MTNDPIVSKLNEYISEQADKHLSEMKSTHGSNSQAKGQQRFCSDCKHCVKSSSNPEHWLCRSPKNGINVVSGKSNTVYCEENRFSKPTKQYSCGEDGLNFEPKVSYFLDDRLIDYIQVPPYLPTHTTNS
jgi:hypothetical protein